MNKYMRSARILPVLVLSLLVFCGGCRRKTISKIPDDALPVAEESAASGAATEADSGSAMNSGRNVAGSVSKPQTAGVEDPQVITDLSLIKVAEGMPLPKVGDTLYTMNNLPRNACGEYWVRDSMGHVAKLAVCAHGEGYH